MSFRKFRDEEGRRWQVRVASRSEWLLEPIGGTPGPARRGAAPLHAGSDPFEVSEEELRRILADARPVGGRAPGDEGSTSGHGSADGGARESPFGDDWQPPEKKSPFLDD